MSAVPVETLERIVDLILISTVADALVLEVAHAVERHFGLSVRVREFAAIGVRLANLRITRREFVADPAAADCRRGGDFSCREE